MMKVKSQIKHQRSRWKGARRERETEENAHTHHLINNKNNKIIDVFVDSSYFYWDI